ncbi:50S ribosomal protein L25 [Alphaproteobacteria bacterium]|nr:50S ribosomal protein L25 [Alphaproteobacteria bacterium]
MSTNITLSVEARERCGKGAARETRRKGLVPGVIYGLKQPPVAIAVSPKDLWAEMNRPGFYTHLFSVVLAGKAEPCLVRDVQKHPVSDKPIHVDFLRVDPSAKINVRVPVHFGNQEKSAGLKRGGVLNVVLHELELIAPAGAIPSAVVVDVADLDIGANVQVKSLVLPEGAVLASHYETDAVIATIASPTVQMEAAARTEEAAAPTEGA